MSGKDSVLKAKDRPAHYGPDIDLDTYVSKGVNHPKVKSLKDLSEYESLCLEVGFDTSEKDRAGSFLQLDHSPIFSGSRVDGLEVLDIQTAMKAYTWLKDYMWHALPSDQDKYTAHVALASTGGYFIRALPGAKAVFPLQACLLIEENKVAQSIHNIIIAEEGAELNIFTGCLVTPHVNSALHIGVSEFYIKKNAKVTFTMIHRWNRGVDVRPRTGVVVEDNGTYISNYICIHPVKSLQTYPVANLLGQNAKVVFQTIIYAGESSLLDVGSAAYLKGPGSRVEIVSRAVARDKAKITVRGKLTSEASPSRGHLECRGLMLSDEAMILAIPELESRASGAELSHEAAVGKILEEEIFYLMTRGLSADEAVSMIIRGFMNINMEGLPPKLDDEIKRLLRLRMGKL